MLVAVQEFAFTQHCGTIFVTSINGELRVHFGDLPVSSKSSGKDSFVVAMMTVTNLG